jgi:predicted amidohydrolase
MKTAAVHFETIFADVTQNLNNAESLVREAAKNQSDIVIFPEFFTTGFAFSQKLIEAVAQSTDPSAYLKRWAATYHIVVGGSYLFFDGIDARNTFCLAFPDGQMFYHSKDIPTVLENFCYTYGDKNNVLETPIGNIGVAMCWENMRYDTVRRMQGKVDFIVGGSCWWELCESDGPEAIKLKAFSAEQAVIAPIHVAELLGVPFVHASHHARFEYYVLSGEKVVQIRQIMGATQIIDGKGKVLARRMYDEHQKIIYAQIDTNLRSTSQIHTDEYWIPHLSPEFTEYWNHTSVKFDTYYKQVSVPYYRNHFQK